MAIPKNAIISNLRVNHNTPNFRTESMSLIERTKSRGLHRIEGSFDLSMGGSIKDQKAMTLFLLEAEGSLNSFELDLPRHFKSELDQNPTIIQSKGKGSTLIPLSAFAGEIDAGSCFTIPNDSKIYYIKQDATSGDEIRIYPALRQNILAGSELNFINPVMRVRFEDDSQTVKYNNNGLIVEIGVKFKEAL